MFYEKEKIYPILQILLTLLFSKNESIFINSILLSEVDIKKNNSQEI